MVHPSGDQLEITAAGYRAVVTQSGGALRLLEHRGRALVDGFGEAEMSSGGRGQLLVPWPNRIRDGAYEFGGRRHQLALSEPKAGNASHGLARWAAWTPTQHETDSASLTYRVMAQTGYPWTVDLQVDYRLSEDGLQVTQTATNTAGEPAPYASGAHPYLRVGDRVDDLELTLPAEARTLVDERLLPVGSEDVDGTAYDFRRGARIGGTELNHAFGSLLRDDAGTATVTLLDPVSGEGVALWADRTHRWFQVYTADDVPATARRSLAVEPMTAQADAFNSGQDLMVLGPAGSPEATVSASWGIRAVHP